jgi:hypothetical protein
MVPRGPKPLNPLPPGETPPQQVVTRLSDTRLKMGDIEFDSQKRSITFPAKVNMRQGNLEYLLVAEHGKVHEALLSTQVQPFYLNMVFLLLKYQKAANFLPLLPGENAKRTAPVLDESNSFDVELSWTDSDGKVHRAPLNDWLHNEQTKKTAPRARWVYTGDSVDDNNSFVPQLEGSMVACYTDYVAMINSPLEGRDNDEIWTPAPQVPAVDSKVEITFFPFREAAADQTQGSKK